MQYVNDKLSEWIKCYQMPRYGNMYIRNGTMEQVKFFDSLNFKKIDKSIPHKIPPNSIVRYTLRYYGQYGILGSDSEYCHILTNEEKQVFDNFLQNSKNTQRVITDLSESCNAKYGVNVSNVYRYNQDEKYFDANSIF